MKVEILTIAEAELAEAVSYYNEQSERLGYEFAVEVRHTIARIIWFPFAWTSLSARARPAGPSDFLMAWYTRFVATWSLLLP
jgi:hypothetical protein